MTISKSHKRKYNSRYQHMTDMGLDSDRLLSTEFQVDSMKAVVGMDGADTVQHYEIIQYH